MACFGTKSADWNQSHHWKPETLGMVYRELIEKHGQVNVNRPVPGLMFTKRYNSLESTDLIVFRRLPSHIIVTHPARLFRTMSWRYNGLIHFESDCYWTFDYKYEYGGEWLFDKMPVRLLTHCYSGPDNLRFIKPTKTQQLSLF